MSSRRTERLGTAVLALLLTTSAAGLESDRQQPLDLKAANSDGSFGDGVTVLSGGVEIRQGTLHVRADRMSIEKLDGKIRMITLTGTPATLEQEIQDQGRVHAEARTVTYRVDEGLVNLTGDADVTHPQYQISGDSLDYDLDRQHFRGTGSDAGEGRIRIRMDPAVAPELDPDATAEEDDG